MNLVIDASVAIKWFVAETGHEAASRLRPLHNDFHAPDLLIVEVTNAAWKKVMRREIDPPHAEQIAHHLPRYIHTLHEATALSIRALEIAISLQHPVYDCLYLACAERVDGAMITADRRLLEAVRTTPFASRVHHLAALPGELLPV